MNNYLQSLKKIEQSSYELLGSDYPAEGCPEGCKGSAKGDDRISPELKKTAASLSKSVQPCLEEIQQSATRLHGLILACLDELNDAEKALLSKEKTVAISKPEIWEQIGELSGLGIKIRKLVEQDSSRAKKEAKLAWYQLIVHLNNKWFVNREGERKKEIDYRKNDDFIKYIKPNIYIQSKNISEIINHKLIKLDQEINNIYLKSLRHCFSLIDQQNKSDLSLNLNLSKDETIGKFSDIKKRLNTKLDELLKKSVLVKKIEFNSIKNDSKSESITDYMSKRFQGFVNTVSLTLEIWEDGSKGSIYWQDVVKFKDEVDLELDSFITAIFDDRLRLITQAIEQALYFYNDLLEKQEEYQQETPEQSQAEKAWIEQQRRELEQVRSSIEAILNQDNA